MQQLVIRLNATRVPADQVGVWLANPIQELARSGYPSAPVPINTPDGVQVGEYYISGEDPTPAKAKKKKPV